MYIPVPFHFNPVRELEGMIRAPGIFSDKIPIGEKAHALHLHTAGPSPWGIADAMEDRRGRKPSHASVFNWARFREPGQLALHIHIHARLRTDNGGL